MKLISRLNKLIFSIRNPILRQGRARRVVFFYPGEEGTYLEHCDVTVYRSGVVDVSGKQEQTMCHMQNCEILWRFSEENSQSKVRLLRKLGSPQSQTASLEETLGSTPSEDLLNPKTYQPPSTDLEQ